MSNLFKIGSVFFEQEQIDHLLWREKKKDLKERNKNKN
jgi:hypothetical protein